MSDTPDPGTTARESPARSLGAGRDSGVEPEVVPEVAVVPVVETVVGDDTVAIHRAPRFLRFMIAGGVVGLVVALILTFSFPEPPGFDYSQVFGFLALFCGVAGFALGAVVALLIDRASRRASKTIVVERVEGGGDAEPFDDIESTTSQV